MSKRSKIALTALAGVSALALAGCKEEEKAQSQVFESLAQCQAEANKPNSWWTLEECDASFAEAEKAHVETAPRYDALAVCEEQHGPGNCQSAQASGGGGSIWMPLLGGYILGNMLSNNSSRPLAQPIYPTRDGKYATPGGTTRLSSNHGSTTLSTKAFKPAPKTLGKPAMTKASVTSKGGFGRSTTSSRSSFGG